MAPRRIVLLVSYAALTGPWQLTDSWSRACFAAAVCFDDAASFTVAASSSGCAVLCGDQSPNFLLTKYISSE